MTLTEEEVYDLYGVPNQPQPTNPDTGEPSHITVDEVLAVRGNRYGSFKSHAAISQQLAQTFYQHMMSRSDTPQLPPYMVESLNMIFHKLGRIANGDPYYDDSWRDIAGYSQLVVDILNNKNT